MLTQCLRGSRAGSCLAWQACRLAPSVRLQSCLLCAQGRAFRAEGALGVALVNSMKGSTVAVVSGLLFCRGAHPGQCLTLASSLSAATITAGAPRLTC